MFLITAIKLPLSKCYHTKILTRHVLFPKCTCEHDFCFQQWRKTAPFLLSGSPALLTSNNNALKHIFNCRIYEGSFDQVYSFWVKWGDFNDFATFGKVEHSAYSTAGKEVFSIPCSFISLRLSGLVQLALVTNSPLLHCFLLGCVTVAKC